VTAEHPPLVFGPVPSRRLGRSLGVNNIPPKVCSYSCVYCQAGNTTRLEIERQRFRNPAEIGRAVRECAEVMAARGERIDYVTFVPDGEPTLDLGLGHAIDLIKPLGFPVAVVTNGSLLWREGIRDALMRADWVCLKVDAVREATWRRINRPDRRLSVDQVLRGHHEFARVFAGTLTTETLLVAGINDQADELQAIADRLGVLRPATAWLSVPTRPPTERFVRAPAADAIDRAREILAHRVGRVVNLTARDPDEFSGTGKVADDLIAIAAVHPLRESAVVALLRAAGADWSVVETLLERRLLSAIDYEGERFYRTAPP
jgi:wyosine [tRNA(Phe)-imidazoG37] synthetase (radical SAM superfamily)